MVVIVIIGLLSTVVLINVLPSRDTAMREKARADIAILEQAIESYRLDNFVYPSTRDGLEALVSAPEGLARPERYREGGYIRRLPADPWGAPYQYARPGRSAPFEILSLGADGRLGGDGADADIVLGETP
jgi:general secretion pathway protein G